MTVRNTAPLILLIVLLSFVSSSQLGGQEVQHSPQSIRKALQQGWQHLKSIDESSRQYTVEEEFASHTRKGVRKTMHSAEVHMAVEYFLGDFRNPDIGDELIIGHNPSYTFYIKKEKNASDWQLGVFGEGTDIKKNSALARAFGSLNVYNYYPLSAVAGELAEEWLNDPRITITKVVWDGSKRYRVSCTSRGVGQPHAQPNKPYHLESIMTVDPNMDWCVLEIDQHGVGLTADYHMKREVAWDGPRLICRRVTENEMYVIPVERSWQFDNYKFDVKDAPETFYLSHYDLPEPMGVKPPPTSRTWQWLLAAAFAAAVLAILFAWLKRRRSMASQVKTQIATRSR